MARPPTPRLTPNKPVTDEELAAADAAKAERQTDEERAKAHARAAARLERYERAKQEVATAKAAAANGKPAPDTPALQAIKERKPVTTTTSPSPTAEHEPAPDLKGFKPVPLRTDKHASVVRSALARKGLESKVDGLHLMVRTTEAQQIVDALSAQATKVSKVIYDARLVVATLVQVRHQFPKTTDTRRGSITKLVDGLVALKAAGSIDGWGVTVELDGTLRWDVNGKAVDTANVVARDLLPKVDKAVAKVAA